MYFHCGFAYVDTACINAGTFLRQSALYWIKLKCVYILSTLHINSTK